MDENLNNEEVKAEGNTPEVTSEESTEATPVVEETTEGTPEEVTPEGEKTDSENA